MYSLEPLAQPASFSFTPVPSGLLQRQCASPLACGACEECRHQAPSLQREALEEREPQTVPSVVKAVLRSPGQPLAAATLAEMESRLGHDFSRVRIHTDSQAIASAQVVRARAYTVSHHVVFGQAQYNPNTATGQRLLAHELAHVVQQGGDRTISSSPSVHWSSANQSQEQEADRASQLVTAQPFPQSQNRLTPGRHGVLQRQPSPNLQLNLQINEQGTVDITLAGPELPLVGNPTIGIRRTPDNRYDLLVGGKGKTVAASDIPPLLQGMMGSGKAGSKPPQRFRVPTCGQLRSASGTRFMNFAEYQVSQMISGDLLPMTPSLYEALIESCRPKPIALPPVQLEDAPQRRLPVGMERV